MRELMLLLFLHAIALFLFTSGFFLTRYESTEVSKCEEKSVAPSRLRGGANDVGCWSEVKFKRVIYVVIDALRYDFMKKATRDEQIEKAKDGGQYFLNHLPHVHHLLETQPANSLLFRFVADAPTMTMQRLKGLTTGSLPTFLDIKDNMNSEEIVEDSWIKQLRALNKNIVFMGDDTWDKLYPNAFLRKYSYDSFNVKDLHTVDNGVLEHFFPELENQTDWDVLIAHFLGVDHVGHTFGPNHPSMESKLEQMDKFLEKLTSKLAPDTLTVVLGDHGMSSDGNHGGASDDETGAALFLYSKATPLHAINSKKESIYDTQSTKKNKRTIAQVDLLPTISLLTGLPIPFGNLGAIIPHLFFFPTSGSLQDAWNQLNEAALINVNQLRYYFQTTQTIRMDLPAMLQLEELYQEAKRAESPIQQHQLYYQYLEDALDLSRSLYTQFDLVSMTHGIFLLFLSSLISITQSKVNSTWLPPSIILGFLLAFFWQYLPLSILNYLPGAILPRGLLCIGYGICTFGMEWQGIAISTSPIALCVVILAVFHLGSLFSNSYLNVQEHILYFCSASFALMQGLQLIANIQTSKISKKNLVAFGLYCVIHRLIMAVPTPNIVYNTISLEYTILPMIIIGIAITMYHPISLVSYFCICLYWCEFFPTVLPWVVYSAFLFQPKNWMSFALVFLILLGPTSPGILVLFGLIMNLRPYLPSLSPWGICFLIHLFYFRTGHGNSFTSLQNAAGFVGVEEFNWYVAGILLAINTFGSFWLAFYFVPAKHLPTILTFFSISALCTTIFVAFQRRHLMVWAIFAPKYVYDGMILLAVNGMVVCRSIFKDEKH